LERTVADIGEFVPRGGWNIRECSRHDVDLADAFLILDLGLGAEWFARVTVSQADKLLKLRPVCWPLFALLFFESLLFRGKSFALPDSIIGATDGLGRANLRRALRQLEAGGLISIRRQPPKPPQITIL
jgi:hypothetical protein